jgi:hypothetical protein
MSNIAVGCGPNISKCMSYPIRSASGREATAGTASAGDNFNEKGIVASERILLLLLLTACSLTQNSRSDHRPDPGP